MKIRVFDLDRHVTDELLSAHFKPFGIVSSVVIVKDKITGQSKRFGFVEMANEEEARAAIKALHHTRILQDRIRVKDSSINPAPRAIPAASPGVKTARQAYSTDKRPFSKRYAKPYPHFSKRDEGKTASSQPKTGKPAYKPYGERPYKPSGKKISQSSSSSARYDKKPVGNQPFERYRK